MIMREQEAQGTGGVFDHLSREGLFWNPAWVSQYEGPLSILWKLAFANVLSPSAIAKVLSVHLGRHSSYQALNRSSLLDTSQINWHRTEKSYFNKLIAQAAHLPIQSFVLNRFATDERIRYCRDCIDEHFHSAVFQVEGLKQCPIHGESLLDRCHRCKYMTARYAMTYETMATPFCCYHCGAHLGYGAKPSSPRFVLNRKGGEALKPFMDYLASLDRFRIEWPGFNLWHCGWDASVWAVGSYHRKAFLSLMSRVSPDVAGAQYINSLSIQLYAERNDCQIADVNEAVLVQRTLAYQTIKERIWRSMRQHRNSGCFTKSMSRMRQFDEAIYPDSPVCPICFAYALWVNHFEVCGFGTLFMLNPSPICLRDSKRDWMINARISEKAWSIFCLWSFRSLLNTARHWNNATKEITSDYLKPDILISNLNRYRFEMNPKLGIGPLSISSFVLRENNKCPQFLIVWVKPAESEVDLLFDGDAVV